MTIFNSYVKLPEGNRGWPMLINREGPTQSSIAILFGMWVLINSGVLIHIELKITENHLAKYVPFHCQFCLTTILVRVDALFPG